MRVASGLGIAGVLALAGCAQLFGIEEGTPSDGGGEPAGPGPSTGTTGEGGDGGTGNGGTGNGGANSGCVDPSIDCALPADECKVAACAESECSVEDVAPGVGVDDPTPGDCRHTECDGAGNPVLDAVARSEPCAFDGGTVCNAGGLCIDPRWADWPMPNVDNDLNGGAPNAMSYTDHPDGTVTDDVTGLIWQQAVDAGTYDWAGAMAFCEALDLAMHTDWRLPSRIELVSILDYDDTNPAIREVAFPGTPSEEFWSSTLGAGGASMAWQVSFDEGVVRDASVENTYRVRCVR